MQRFVICEAVLRRSRWKTVLRDTVPSSRGDHDVLTDLRRLFESLFEAPTHEVSNVTRGALEEVSEKNRINKFQGSNLTGWSDVP